MADDIVAHLADMATDHGRHRTHYEGCHVYHLECAALMVCAEIERLQRWKSEATTVIEDWEAVFDALIDAKPTDLGVSKSVLVAKEIILLRCDNGELRTRIEELEDNHA